MAAIYIIITFAFIYGDQVIGWDADVRIYMFIIVQITAAIGALFFGILQDKIGAKITYIITLFLWTIGIVLIYVTPPLTLLANQVLGVYWQAQYIFLIVGIVAGLSLGSSQSAGRALVGMFSPDSKAAEFFGFWGLSHKLAGVFGVIGLGLLQAQYGPQNAILFCAFLFIVAIIVCFFVNQQRGIDAVGEYNRASALK